jgi:hypothetical protein
LRWTVTSKAAPQLAAADVMSIEAGVFVVPLRFNRNAQTFDDLFGVSIDVKACEARLLCDFLTQDRRGDCI